MMKKKIRLLSVLLAALLVIGLFAGTALAEDTYTIRIGLPTGGKHHQNYFAEKFAEYLDELSGGTIKAEIYPAGQLGTTAQMQESVLNGSLQALGLPAAYLSSTAPVAGVLDIPFLFNEKDTNEQYFRILNSGTSLDEYLYSQGYDVVWPLSGVNDFMTLTPVTSMADLKGMKIRCHTSMVIQNSISALGATPTMVDTSELASALQNKTIDGLETDVVFACSQKMYDIATNYCKIPMNVSPTAFILSVVWLETLPEDVVAIIKEAEAKALEDEAVYFRQYMDECFAEMEAAGVTIVDPDEQFIADMKAATEGIGEAFAAENEMNAKVYNELVELIAADNEANY